MNVTNAEFSDELHGTHALTSWTQADGQKNNWRFMMPARGRLLGDVKHKDFDEVTVLSLIPTSTL